MTSDQRIIQGSGVEDPPRGRGREPGGVRHATAPSSPYTALAIAFTSIVVISNICATKGVVLFPDLRVSLGPIDIHGLVTDGAFWLFPLSYVLGDVISEVYGFRAMRRVIAFGFAASLFVAVAFKVTIGLPAAGFYENQEALESVVGVVPQILGASLLGFLAGELLNSLVLVKMKERTGERRLWARLMGSTLAGELADTTIFCLIAASAIGISTGSDLLNYVVVGFVWKSLCEAMVMPITYAVVGVLKRREPSYWAAESA